MELPIALDDPQFQEKSAEHIRQLYIQGYLTGIAYAIFDRYAFHIVRRLSYFAFLLLGFLGRRNDWTGYNRIAVEVPFLLYAIRRICWTGVGSLLLVTSVNLSLSLAPELVASYHATVADRSAAVVGLFIMHSNTCIALLIMALFHVSFRLGLAIFIALPSLAYLAFLNTALLLRMTHLIPAPIRRVLFSPLLAANYINVFMQYRLGPRFHRFLNRIERRRIASLTDGIRLRPQYKFKPLTEARSMRVLVVERRKMFRPPRCRLEIVSLEDSSAYIACSYVWGNSTLDHVLCVDGCRLAITKSAYNVVRQQQSFWSERKVWIDAICINQSDLLEKSDQISHMGEIYGHALWVDAYLKFGYGDADVWAILNEMLVKNVLNEKFGTTDRDLYQQFNLKPYWSTFADLLSSEWFNRIWVMQEAMLAGDLYLIYEQVRIDWPRFRTIVEAMDTAVLKETLSFTQSFEKQGYVGDLVDRPLSLVYVRRFIKRGESTLFDILSYFRSQEATEPRDHVYALLSLASEEVRKVIKIDYNISLDRLFTKVMICVMLQRGLICLLSCGKPLHHSSDTDIPSWVIDWSQYEQILNRYDVPTWQAATNVAPFFGDKHWSLSFNGKGLLVSMMTAMDHVGESLVPPHLELQTGLEDMHEISLQRHRWLSESLEMLHRVFADKDDEGFALIKDAFYRTLTYDHADPDDEVTLHWDKPGFRSDYQFLEETFNIRGKYEDSPMYQMQQDWLKPFRALPEFRHLTPMQMAGKAYTDPDSIRDVPLQGVPVEKFQQFMEIVARLNAIWNRLKFAVGKRNGVTEHGRLASFPHNARAGDEICLIAGAQAAFVVRKVDRPEWAQHDLSGVNEHRQFIGWCYLHNGMDGSLATGPWQNCYLV